MANVFLGTIIAWPIDFAPRGWTFCEGQLLQISDNAALYSLLSTYYGGNGRDTFGIPDLRGRTPIGCGVGPGIKPKFLGQLSGYEMLPAEHFLASHAHQMPESGMGADFTNAQLSITASEMTVNSSGTYGVPITSEALDPASMPADSEHYIGATKLNNGAPLNSYYKANANPTVTTNPTAISVSGKVTPSISGILSGSVPVTVAKNLTVGQAGHNNSMVPLMQPSLSLNYIICLVGEYPSRS